MMLVNNMFRFSGSPSSNNSSANVHFGTVVLCPPITVQLCRPITCKLLEVSVILSIIKYLITAEQLRAQIIRVHAKIW